MSVARQRGFTFFETVVVVAAAGLLYMLLGESLSASSGLTRTSRASLQANDDQRRSLDAISGVLRGAAWSTLVGFDVNDQATTVSFQRPVAADVNGAVLGPVETVRWRVGAAVDGMQTVGEVVHVTGGTTTVLAPRVPSGGFRLERTGTTVKVLLTTFASTSQRAVTQSDAEALVALRN